MQRIFSPQLGSLAIFLFAATPALADAPLRLVVRPAEILLDGLGDRHRVLIAAVSDDRHESDVTTQAVYSSQKAKSPQCLHMANAGLVAMGRVC